MDLGTGSFIVSSALTSQFARTGSVDGTHFLSWKRLIVLALALSRTLSIKLLGYQEHVSEYGIHWNFFATLYFVWGISDLVHRLIPSKLIIIVAIGGIALYQYAIIQFDIAHYVLSDDRVGFFAENKEGILSLAGYGALYLISEGVAKAMFYSTDKQDASTLRTNMLLFSLFAWVGWYLAAVFVQPTSRRLCNLTYTLLTVAICWSVLMGFYVLGSVGKGRDVILSSFSASSLPIFLLANVMTGGVNMSIRTLHTEPSTALAILLLYGLVLSAVAWGYHGYRHPVRMAGGQSGPT